MSAPRTSSVAGAKSVHVKEKRSQPSKSSSFYYTPSSTSPGSRRRESGGSIAKWAALSLLVAALGALIYWAEGVKVSVLST